MRTAVEIELRHKVSRRGPDPSEEVQRLVEAASRGKGVLFLASSRRRRAVLRHRLYEAARRSGARVTTEMRENGLAALRDGE